MTFIDRLKNQIRKILKYLWLSIWSILEIPVAFILEAFPPTRLAFWFKDNFRSLWDRIIAIGWIQNAISKAVFRRFGGVTPPRPHQATMADDYTSWKGLVDKSFTGRHLPADPDYDTRTRPPAEDVVALFLRPEDDSPGGTMEPDMRSTLLFASFAQWFTDSFLRTSHQFQFDKNGNVLLKDGVPVRKDGREKYNDSTHEIDLCQIYGLNAEMTEQLRSKKDGCLRSQMIDGEEFPEFLLSEAPTEPNKPLPIKPEFDGLHDERILRHIFRSTTTPERYKTLFATGLEHSNSTLGNALLNVVFLRMHNKIAREMASKNDWDDDQVFETTRNTMIVILLNIVVSDYVRHISPLSLPLKFQEGMAEEETWYRRNRIHIEFNILYRWHGLVPSAFSFLPNPEDSADFRHNNNWLIHKGVGAALTDFSNEPAGKMILGNTPRFLAGVKQDTVAIMRASKLQTYNSYRERFGLKAAKNFDDVTDDPKLARQLEDMYGEIENLEWYVGMCSESHGRGMIMGDMLFNMVAHDAFTHALTNPLLSKEVFREDTFGPIGWKYIQEVTTLSGIVTHVVNGKSPTCHFAMNGVHTDRDN